MELKDIKEKHPAIDSIMHEFDIIWPKVVWFDEDLKPYHDLIRSIYAHAMAVTIDHLEENAEAVTVH